MNRKKILTPIAALLFGFTTMAQYGKTATSTNDLAYDVRPLYTRPVVKEVLSDAKYISDVVPGYPSNWITSYISVEIIAKCNGKTVTAKSANEVLSAEQKNILKTVDLATNLIVLVNYKHTDETTHMTETKKMNVSMSVAPDVEAQFVGGNKLLANYLKDKISAKVSEATLKQLHAAKIKFTISENGAVTNPKLISSTKDAKIDAVLLEVISTMPKWLPAQDFKGTGIQQDFEFSMGVPGC